MCPEPARTTPITPTVPTTKCRNCGANVSGEYCAVCGQETRVKLPTARVFLREATGRYVAIDGRLWRTLAALLFRPGFLTREYFAGRRRRYIRPARLFLVLSLALFATIRIFASAPVLIGDESAADANAKSGAKAPSRTSKSSALASEEPLVKFDDKENGGEIFSVPGFTINVDRDLNLTIPGADEPWSRELKKRFEHFNGLNRQEKSEQVFLGVVRYGPYAMIVLMPAFALLQMVAYFGRARRYPDRPSRYAEHIVFAAHTHAFLFLVGVLALAIPLSWVRVTLGCWCLLYGLWATKKVYRGGWIGLLARALVVGWAYIFLFALVVVGLVAAAVLLR